MKLRCLIYLAAFLSIGSSSYSQTFNWVNTAGSLDADGVQSLCVDSSSNIYSFGFFKDTLRLNNSSLSYTPNGGVDMFLIKNRQNGNYISSLHIGGLGDDWPTSIHYSDSGFIYILGIVSDSTYIDDGVSSTLLFSDSNNNAYNGGFVIKLDLNLNIKWSRFLKSPMLSINDVAVDGSSNVFVVGSYYDSLGFGISNSTFNQFSSNTTSGYLAKFSPNGTLLDATSIRGSNLPNVKKVEASGNIITVSGTFRGTLDADPSQNTFNLQNIGGYDIFFCQYNSDFTLRWAKSINSKFQADAYSLIQNGDQIYIGGVYADTAYFNPLDSSAYLASLGNWDAFIAKYDINGNYLWAKSFGDTTADYLQAFAINDSNEIYLTGLFHGRIDLDPDTGIYYISSVNNSRDVFISKLDSSGSFMWGDGFGGNSLDYSYDMIEANNNLYIGGAFRNTVDFDLDTAQALRSSFGDTDAYLLKLGLSIVSSINENASKTLHSADAFEVYPNPANGVISIEADSKQVILVNIFDLSGKLVFQRRGASITALDISSLSEGGYILNVLFQDLRVASKKLLISK